MIETNKLQKANHDLNTETVLRVEEFKRNKDKENFT